MKSYINTRLNKARGMTRGEYNKFKGWSIPKDENPNDAGYFIDYGNGYTTWQPKEEFEKYNIEITAGSNIDFSEALKYLKRGLKVAREGWNGKGLYIQIEDGGDYKFSEILPFFVIKNTLNSFNTWVPSVSDLLANDWMVYMKDNKLN